MACGGCAQRRAAAAKAAPGQTAKIVYVVGDTRFDDYDAALVQAQESGGTVRSAMEMRPPASV